MKRNLWKSALEDSLMLAAAFTGSAGPLQRTDVANDPIWVLHLDCDALKQTVVGKMQSLNRDFRNAVQFLVASVP